MANKKEMMVLGAAVAGAASYYFYGKMKPKEEAGKNNGNPALNESKLRDSGKSTTENKPKSSTVKESNLKTIDDKTAKDALDAIQKPEVKREKPRGQAEKESLKEKSA